MKYIPQNPRIALAGSVRSSRRTLEVMLEEGANVVGVLGLSEAASKMVSGYVRLDKIAADRGIPYSDFTSINEQGVSSLLEAWAPDLLFVVGLSQIVGSAVLALPSFGCVGFHPTKLPRGRGRAPLAWLTLDGEGGAATFFLMGGEVDAGPILVQEAFETGADDSAADVLRAIEGAITRGLRRWLPEVIRGVLELKPQDPELATYNGRRGPADGLIDWHWAASDIHALVRASSHPYPGAYTYAAGKKLIVWGSAVEPRLPYRGVPGRVLCYDSAHGWLVQAGQGLIWLRQVESAAASDEALRKLLKVGRRLGYAAQDEIHALRERVAGLEQRLVEIAASLPRAEARQGSSVEPT